MDTAVTIVIGSIVLLLLVFPLLFFFRRSTDTSLEGRYLVLKYPFKTEKIKLDDELRSWQLQEAYLLRWGKIYAIGIELKNGKWKNINSRFNADNFNEILQHLESQFSAERKKDVK